MVGYRGRRVSFGGFVGVLRHNDLMPRKRERDAHRAVHRTARCGLRVTPRQRERVFGLLRSAGDVWCCVLELNGWRRRRQDAPLAGYQELCRELAVSGPGTFGEIKITAPGAPGEFDLYHLLRRAIDTARSPDTIRTVPLCPEPGGIIAWGDTEDGWTFSWSPAGDQCTD